MVAKIQKEGDYYRFHLIRKITSGVWAWVEPSWGRGSKILGTCCDYFRNFKEKRSMGMNKNGICGWASFFTLIVGIALVLLGVIKYREYAIGFSTVGIGFFIMSWAFNALKGRV